jgi:hypothetical protein
MPHEIAAFGSEFRSESGLQLEIRGQLALF